MKIVIFLVIMLSLVVVISTINVYYVRTPELFGDSRLVYAELAGRSIGVISDTYTTLLFMGIRDGDRVVCQMVWIAGTPIGGSEHGVPCEMTFKNNHFRGWIEFRGHPRKFCGAIRHENLPCK